MTSTIYGTSGNDTLAGTAGDDIFAVEQGGEDNVSGLGGDDSFHFGASFDTGDAVDGGTGSDSLLLRGDYSAGVVFGATTMVNVEKIELGAGFDYNLTTNDATVASGASLFVDAARLGAGNALTFDGSAETDGRFVIEGGKGNDTLTGGAGNDIFRLDQGGNDTANGGDGDDVFIMGASLTASDRIDGGLDGGNGHNTLRLNGDYSAGLTLGPDTIQDIQNIQFDAGHSYSITTDDNNFLSGPTIVIDGGNLGAGDNLTFDAGAEGDANFRFIGGAGDNTLTGGASADYFDLTRGGFDIVSGGGLGDTFDMGTHFTPGDQIDGGSGNDTVILDGLGIADGFTFNADTMVNVENLVLLGGHSYNMTTDDATVAAGATLLVNAVRLGASDRLTFNGLSETNGSFDFRVGAHFTASDSISGGAGSDTLTLNGDYSAGLVFGNATMTGVETLNLVGDHSYDLTTANATVASGATLTVDASALGAGDTLTFDGSAETNGLFAITGGAGDDTITLTNSSVFAGSAIDGGGGNDTVILNGDFSSGIAFSPDTITNVETLRLDAGHNYILTTDDGNVASGATLTVDASALGAGNSLDFDGSAETDGHFILRGGAGNDGLTGGQDGDTFDLTKGGNDTVIGGAGDDTVNMGATLTAADQLNGGGSVFFNTVTLDGDYSAGLTLGATTLVNFGDIVLGGGYSYTLTTNDATVAAGTEMTVDATALGTGDTLIFNGAAETDGNFAFEFGAGFTATDQLTGSSNAGGNDSLSLDGDYNGANALVLNANTLQGIGSITVEAGYSYYITVNAATVAAGATLVVDGGALGAGDALYFNGMPEANGKFHIIGGPGDDLIFGGQGHDYIDISEGGDDTVNGDSGGDTIYAGGALTAADSITGGSGSDSLVLDGSYDLAFNGGTISSVETITLDAGTVATPTSYTLILDPNNVAGGASLLIDASALLADDHVDIDGENISSGSTLIFVGGVSNHEIFIGGSGNDYFNLSAGGTYNAQGGPGNDTFAVGADLTTSDIIAGGQLAENNTMVMDGDYSAGFTFDGSFISDIETFQLGAGHSYNLTFTSGYATGAGTITVDASALGAGDTLTLNATGETDPMTIASGGGADVIHLSPTNSDTFVYYTVSASTSTGYDTISGIDFSSDNFVTSPAGAATTGVDAAVAGSLSTASFDSDLAAAIGAGQLAAHHALLFTANAGTLSGQTFLVIDENGTAGYQAGADLVIDVTGYGGTLTTGDFS